jgi:hypothetical protein
MTDEMAGLRWRAVGGTVAGASHVRAGRPNQDAIRLPRDGEMPSVVAVSDGHGSDKCFRSDRGSRIAVAAAVVVLGELVARAGDEQAAAVLESARAHVPAELARRWREAVELDLASEPFTGEELDALEAKDGARARASVTSNPLLAYGATVVGAAITSSYIVFAQLGDGDILVVSEAGEVARPLPADSRLFANETTSLASPTADRDFRLAVVPLDDPPVLLLLSTDGYANSFRDEAEFLKVGRDLIEMIGASGLDAVARDIPTWLDETSRLGSGDDVTLAIACRPDAIRAPGGEEAPAAPTIEAEPSAEAPPADEAAPVEPAKVADE